MGDSRSFSGRVSACFLLNVYTLSLSQIVAIYAWSRQCIIIPIMIALSNCDHLISICRKYTMLLNNLVIVVAVGLQSLAVHPIMFIVGRFVSGINSGNISHPKRHCHVKLLVLSECWARNLFAIPAYKHSSWSTKYTCIMFIVLPLSCHYSKVCWLTFELIKQLLYNTVLLLCTFLFYTHDHAGTNTAVLPLYMTEIPPVSLRGSVGLCHQLGITGAILLSQILGLSYVSLYVFMMMIKALQR